MSGMKPKREKGKADAAKTRKRTKLTTNTSDPMKNKGGRPSSVALAQSEIAKACSVREETVAEIMAAIEGMAVKSLKENGVFRMSFMTIKVRVRRARPATPKIVFGKEIVLKPLPEMKIVRAFLSKPFQELCT